MIRRRISTEVRCWTTHIFKRCYKNHPPITFMQSTKIIEDVHAAMYEFMFKTGRPVEIHKNIGAVEIRKRKQNNNNLVVNWKKTKERHKLIRDLNHHTNGYIWNIKFLSSRYIRMGLYKFKPLDMFKYILADKIKSKQIQ